MLKRTRMAGVRARSPVNDEAALIRRRDNNVRRLLVAATRTINRHITTELQRRGYDKTRPGHAALLANLDFEGNSVTEIADRAHISKQAMARLAVELEEMGLITREPSEFDGRVLMLKFTRLGKTVVRASVAIVDDVEVKLAAEMGDRALATLKRALTIIIEHY